MLLSCKTNVEDQGSTWYFNTGASNHMCGKRSMFAELNELVAGNVSFSDDLEISVKGRGNILICAKDSSHQLISDVYYMLDMTYNILSMG